MVIDANRSIGEFGLEAAMLQRKTRGVPRLVRTHASGPKADAVGGLRGAHGPTQALSALSSQHDVQRGHEALRLNATPPCAL